MLSENKSLFPSRHSSTTNWKSIFTFASLHIAFIQDIGLNFLRKNLHCSKEFSVKKRERKSFEKMQGVPLFFSKDEQNREWNPCEILFQLKWSCHRVFCSQREMLLLLLTLISWTNFLSLGIKIWGHAKKLLFPIFHWAVVLQAWPINLLYMLGPSAKKTRRKFTSFLPKQLFSVYNAMDKQTCQSKPNNFKALGDGISHWPVLTYFWIHFLKRQC